MCDTDTVGTASPGRGARRPGGVKQGVVRAELALALWPQSRHRQEGAGPSRQKPLLRKEGSLPRRGRLQHAWPVLLALGTVGRVPNHIHPTCSQ